MTALQSAGTRRAAMLDASPALDAEPAPAGVLERAWRSLRPWPQARRAAVALALLLTACIALPLALPWEPDEIDRSGVVGVQAPSVSHPLGTDALGRDQLARVLSAGRISLGIGFLVAALSLVVGAGVGLVAGYFGGRVDTLVMWMVGVLMSVPTMPLLIGISVLVASPDSHVGALVRSVSEPMRIVLVMASLGWMGFSRIVRAQVLSLRHLDFVRAAEALGASHRRRILVHVLPGCIPAMSVFATFAVSGAILGESFLSFLGVGVNPPTATWGNMLAQSSSIGLVIESWWLVATPAVAILITVLIVNFLGEGLRVALDPQVGS